MGDAEALILADLSDDPFRANTSLERTFRLNPTIDGQVTARWYFNKADQTKLTFNCGTNSVVITDLSDDESEAACTVTAAGANSISVRTTQDAGAVELEVVSKPKGAAVELTTWIDGGTKADGRAPVLMAKLAGSTPIINATIKIQIFDVDSDNIAPVLVRTLNKTHDAGSSRDTRASDGIYTLDLTGLLPAGSYFIIAEGSTDGESKFNPNGVINAVSGISAAASPIGDPIERLAEEEFDLEDGAVGLKVTAVAAPTSTSSGGCTVGGGSDAGLLALLSLAVIGLLRRRFSAVSRRDC